MLRRVVRALRYAVREEELLPTLSAGHPPVVSGTVAYALGAGWTAVDALYFAVATLTTTSVADGARARGPVARRRASARRRGGHHAHAEAGVVRRRLDPRREAEDLEEPLRRAGVAVDLQAPGGDRVGGREVARGELVERGHVGRQRGVGVGGRAHLGAQAAAVQADREGGVVDADRPHGGQPPGPLRIEQGAERVHAPVGRQVFVVAGQPERARAPARDRVEDLLEPGPVLGELVHGRRGGRRQLAARDQPGGLELP